MTVNDVQHYVINFDMHDVTIKLNFQHSNKVIQFKHYVPLLLKKLSLFSDPLKLFNRNIKVILLKQHKYFMQLIGANKKNAYET